MIIPVRCFSCGKPLGHLWEKYLEMSKTEDRKKVLDELGVERICCRGIMLSHVDLLETASRFRKF